MSSRFLTLVSMSCAASVVIATMGPKPAPSLVWNASESVPVGLYRVRPAGKLAVTDLVIALPPEPLATFLADGGCRSSSVCLHFRDRRSVARVLPSSSTESRWGWRASTTAAVDRSPYGRTAASSPTVKCSS
jgi:hypothetical protein